MNKKNNISETRGVVYILLCIIIFLQILVGVRYFSKKNMHLHDEYYTYGIANSYYRPFLYNEDHETGTTSYNRYATGNDFKYYMRTNENTKFSYDSVIYNSSHDTTPPVYYILLHTISSVFSDKFSWWWGFGLNAFAFVIEQFFLYALFAECHSKKLGIAVCLFWGFTLASVYHISYVRMYSLLNAFVIMYIYFSSRYVKSGRKKYIPFIGLSVFLGFLTHYLFICFAFFYTASQCIIQLLNKKIKKMFMFGSSVLLGIVLAFILFPASYRNTFHLDMRWGENPGLLYQLHLIVRLILMDITGIIMPEDSNITIILPTVIAIVLAFSFIAACIIFRNEGYVKRFGDYILKKCKCYFKGEDQTIFCIFIAAFLYLLYVAKSISYSTVGGTCDRYVFLIMPCFVGVVFYIINLIVRKIKVRRYIYAILCIIACGICFLPHISVKEKPYCLTVVPNDDIGGMLSGKDVIVVGEDPRAMVCYSNMLENTKDIYYTLSDLRVYRSEGEKNYIDFIGENTDFWLLVDTAEPIENNDSPEDICGYFAEITGCTPVLRGEQWAYLHKMQLYEFKPQKNK